MEVGKIYYCLVLEILKEIDEFVDFVCENNIDLKGWLKIFVLCIFVDVDVGYCFIDFVKLYLDLFLEIMVED